MPTCAVCGDQLASTAALSCSECGEDFCREHYHGHDCAPEKAGAEPVRDQHADDETGSGSPLAAIGYLISVAAAMLGLFYLALEIDVVIDGAQGIGALQALIHLAVAGTFFSIATFALVATYIATGD